jgi:1-deoxy-D-xylulose-5-phosphate reductoisomerase
MIKTISILGSTGSIGRQALDVADALGIYPAALAADKDFRLMESQARKYRPKTVAMRNENAAKELKARLADTDTKVLSGQSGLNDAAAAESDMVLSAIVGIAGLTPTLSAIEAGRDIALANKETLVCAGSIVTQRAALKNVRIIPVDSEHSAVFQCLNTDNPKHLRRIILTASGGPFYGKTKDELKTVTPEQALKHPNWSMGAKITIDSATLMNKGLELIEAMHLFAVKPEQIDIVIHKESIIHSMVEFTDGAVIAQMGVPDMRLPISYAMTYPDRFDFGGSSLNLFDIGALTFDKPDTETFGCLALAKKAVCTGGTACAVLNGANEAAVELFLKHEIGFNQIAEFVERALDIISVIQNPSLDDILDSDAEARQIINSFKRIR